MWLLPEAQFHLKLLGFHDLKPTLTDATFAIKLYSCDIKGGTLLQFNQVAMACKDRCWCDSSAGLNVTARQSETAFNPCATKDIARHHQHLGVLTDTISSYSLGLSGMQRRAANVGKLGPIKNNLSLIASCPSIAHCEEPSDSSRKLGTGTYSNSGHPWQHGNGGRQVSKVKIWPVASQPAAYLQRIAA